MQLNSQGIIGGPRRISTPSGWRASRTRMLHCCCPHPTRAPPRPSAGEACRSRERQLLEWQPRSHAAGARSIYSSGSPSAFADSFFVSSIVLSRAFSSARAASSPSSVSADSAKMGGGATCVKAVSFVSWP